MFVAQRGHQLTYVMLTLWIVIGSVAQSLPIMADSAGQVKQIARFGIGEVNRVAWSADFKTMALSTQAGLWLYAADQPQMPPRLLGTDVEDVQAVAFTGDGKLLASVNCAKTLDSACAASPIRLWDVKSGQPLNHSLAGQPIWTLNLAFSSDGKTLASSGCETQAANGACTSQSVRLWDTATDQLIGAPLILKDGVASLAFSPDGGQLAAGQGSTVQIIDVKTRQSLLTLKDAGDYVNTMMAVAFSSDGKWVAGAAYGLILWDAQTGRALENMAVPFYVNWLGFRKDGGLLASGLTDDNTLQLRSVRSGTKIASVAIGPTDRISRAVLSPDGSKLITVGHLYKRSHAVVWDVKSGAIDDEFFSRITDYTFLPDNTALFALNRDSDGTRLLSLRGTKERVVLKENTFDAMFSPDGTRILFGYGTTISVRDTRTAAQVALLKSPYRVTEIAISPDNTLLAVGTERDIALWDIQSQKQKNALLFRLPESGLAALAFSPDNRLLASATWLGAVKVWEARTGKLLGTFDGLSGLSQKVNVARLLFSRDGNSLAYSGGGPEADRATKLWNLKTGAQVAMTRGAMYQDALRFNADGTRFVIADENGKTWVLDTQTGKPVFEIPGTISYAFSPDSSLLACGLKDGRMQIWNARTGERQVEWKGHTDRPWTVAFSADGKQIISGSEDGTARLWEVPTS